MPVEIKPGTFVKQVTATEGSEPVTEFLYVMETYKSHPTLREPYAVLVWGGRTKKETSTQYEPTFERSNYTGEEWSGGSIVMPDEMYDDSDPVETRTFTLATDEELVGWWFRIGIEEFIQK